MHLTDEHLALLTSIAAEWNKAEEHIKVAEQVCDNIVIPAIKELRYAGRRIVDAIGKMQSAETHSEVIAFLKEAQFDCHRARHDAIDAATSKLSIDLDIMEKKLGLEVILPVYPDFPSLYKRLNALRVKIRQSRKDRENRAAIYSVLEGDDFPALVDKFNDMRRSEELMVRMARKRRRSEAWGIGGTLLGVVGIALSIYCYFYPISTSANNPSTAAIPNAPTPARARD